MKKQLLFALSCVLACSDIGEADDPSKRVFGGDTTESSTWVPPIEGAMSLLLSRNARKLYYVNPVTGMMEVISIPTNSDGGDHPHATLTKEPPFDVAQHERVGRMAEDTRGLVHLLLPTTGAVAVIDPATQRVERQKICPAPRGITVAGAWMLVVCESGELVSWDHRESKASNVISGGHSVAQTRAPGPSASSDDPQLRSNLLEAPTSIDRIGERDLRDVAVDGQGTVYVSKFRSAEVLVLDAERHVVRRLRPSVVPDPLDKSAHYEPHVASRMVTGADGAVYLLHQYHTTRSIPTKLPNDPNRTLTAPYGGSQTKTGKCDSGEIVIAAVTKIVDGHLAGTILLPGLAPAIDLVVDWEVVVTSQRATVHFQPGGDQVDFADPATAPSCAEGLVGQSGGVTGLTRHPWLGTMLVWRGHVSDTFVGGPCGHGCYLSGTSIDVLPPPRDVGRDIFHTPTAAGIACMTCHPGGGDDGHTWTFQDIGKRRTQSLRGGITHTAPFHWSGDMDDLTQLTHEVFTKRMGGESLSEKQVQILGSWLDRIPPLPSPSIDATKRERGRDVFDRARCGSCHSGNQLTNNESRDVGTGMFQVPSLINVSTHPPFMHDGCASTLMQRFTDPACGGKNHGDTTGLSTNELSDLITYLESL